MVNEKSAENPCTNEEIIRTQAKEIILDLIEKTKLKKGDLLIIGCSSSEIIGNNIGHGSSLRAAQVAFEAIYPELKSRGIELATQCCEHLNRCVILEKGSADKRGYEAVNVVPQPKAGGSFSTTAYNTFENPVAVEKVRADAGLDIGLTLIGMHLKEVAVPVRLCRKTLGEATISAARTRPKFIGGIRANYNEELL